MANEEKNNTLESYSIETPYNIMDTCAKFSIEDVTLPFVLTDITAIGECYTLSFWVKSEASGNLQVYNGIFSTSDKWQKYSVVFTANNTKLYIYFNNIGTYYIYHPKLEIGNKATDWSPAPEDLETSVVELTTRVIDAETAIESTKEAISLRATKTELVETSEKLTTLVGEEIDAIQVGGRNLAKNDTVPSTGINGQNVTYVGTGRLIYTEDILADLVGATSGVPGECITLSFEYRLVSHADSSTDEVKLQIYPYLNSGNTILDTDYIYPTTGWQKYVLTTRAVRMEPEGDYTEGEIHIGDTAGSDNVYEIRKIKLEKGTKATDWTPAPEDMVDVGTFEAYKKTNSAELEVMSDKVAIQVSEQVTQLTSELSDADADLMALYRELRMNYDFTAEGQFIGKKGSNTIMKLVNDMLQILISGNAVTTLDTKGLSADTANIANLRIGDYVLTKGSDGHLRLI